MRRRIGRLGDRNFVGLFRRQDVVGVRNLHLVVEPLYLAGDDPLRARGGQPLDMARRSCKPDQMHKARTIKGTDLDRGTVAVRHDQLFNGDIENADLALDRVGSRGAAALDHAVGRIEGEVAHGRPCQFLDQGCHTRAHALQGRDVRKQGEENLWPHHNHHSLTKRTGEAVSGRLSDRPTF